MAYFPYVTLASGISINSAFFIVAVFKIATNSRFVELSENDIDEFCEQQENENTTKKAYIIPVSSRNLFQCTTVQNTEK